MEDIPFDLLSQGLITIGSERGTRRVSCKSDSKLLGPGMYSNMNRKSRLLDSDDEDDNSNQINNMSEQTLMEQSPYVKGLSSNNDDDNIGEETIKNHIIDSDSDDDIHHSSSKSFPPKLSNTNQRFKKALPPPLPPSPLVGALNATVSPTLNDNRFLLDSPTLLPPSLLLSSSTTATNQRDNDNKYINMIKNTPTSIKSSGILSYSDDSDNEDGGHLQSAYPSSASSAPITSQKKKSGSKSSNSNNLLGSLLIDKQQDPTPFGLKDEDNGSMLNASNNNHNGINNRFHSPGNLLDGYDDGNNSLVDDGSYADYSQLTSSSRLSNTTNNNNNHNNVNLTPSAMSTMSSTPINPLSLSNQYSKDSLFGGHLLQNSPVSMLGNSTNHNIGLHSQSMESTESDLGESSNHSMSSQYSHQHQQHRASFKKGIDIEKTRSAREGHLIEIRKRKKDSKLNQTRFAKVINSNDSDPKSEQERMNRNRIIFVSNERRRLWTNHMRNVNSKIGSENAKQSITQGSLSNGNQQQFSTIESFSFNGSSSISQLLDIFSSQPQFGIDDQKILNNILILEALLTSSSLSDPKMLLYENEPTIMRSFFQYKICSALFLSLQYGMNCFEKTQTSESMDIVLKSLICFTNLAIDFGESILQEDQSASFSLLKLLMRLSLPNNSNIPPISVSTQSILTLSNIISSSPWCREKCLEENIMGLLQQIFAPNNIPALRDRSDLQSYLGAVCSLTSNTLSSLPLQTIMSTNFTPLLATFLLSNDETVLSNILFLFEYLTRDEAFARTFFDLNICDRIIELLNASSDGVQVPAFNILLNILYLRYRLYAETLLSKNILEKLDVTLATPQSSLGMRIDACCCLKLLLQTLKDDENNSHGVILFNNHNYVQILGRMFISFNRSLAEDDYKMKMEVINTLFEIVTHSSNPNTRFEIACNLANIGLVRNLCFVLEFPDISIVYKSLLVLEELLKTVKYETEEEFISNPVVKGLEEVNGFEALEKVRGFYQNIKSDSVASEVIYQCTRILQMFPVIENEM